MPVLPLYRHQSIDLLWHLIYITKLVIYLMKVCLKNWNVLHCYMKITTTGQIFHIGNTDLFGDFGNPASPPRLNFQAGCRGNNLFQQGKSSTKRCLVFVFLLNGFSVTSSGTFHLSVSRKASISLSPIGKMHVISDLLQNYHTYIDVY